MIVLALDTCLATCSVAVADGGRVISHASEQMTRGHQERLAPMVREVMVDAGLGPRDLNRIAATVGPGSFTGLRVGVAFAKGMASALSIPTVGVGALEALAADVAGLAFVAVDARRDQVYGQAFEDGQPLMAPDALTVGSAAARLTEISQGRPLTLIGSGAPLLADLVPGAAVLGGEGADARVVARLGAARSPAPLRPLYLRAPDAKLPA